MGTKWRRWGGVRRSRRVWPVRLRRRRGMRCRLLARAVLVLSALTDGVLIKIVGTNDVGLEDVLNVNNGVWVRLTCQVNIRVHEI